MWFKLAYYSIIDEIKLSRLLSRQKKSIPLATRAMTLLCVSRATVENAASQVCATNCSYLYLLHLQQMYRCCPD